MSGTATTPIPAYVQAYRQALEAAHRARVNEDSLFTLLLTRDTVHRHLSDSRPDAYATFSQIVELDRDLYTLVTQSSNRDRLRDWRAAASPKPECWWWYLDQEPTPGGPRQRSWFWNGLALILYVSGLALLADTARRFLSAGPDVVGSLNVALQAIIALLAIGGALTKPGQEFMARLFRRRPPIQWAKRRAVLAVLFLLFAISACATKPFFALYFNNRGREAERSGDLQTAGWHYERAIQLQPDFYQVHYNLGALQEELYDYEAALTAYRHAQRGGLDLAYSRAARLLILTDKPAEAAALLQTGLTLTTDEDVRPTMIKNLGWAWVELGGYNDAERVLRQSVALDPNMAATHCLMSMALDGLGQSFEAIEFWRGCVRLAGNDVPEEIRWRLLAQEKLREAENRP